MVIKQGYLIRCPYCWSDHIKPTKEASVHMGEWNGNQYEPSGEKLDEPKGGPKP